MRQTGKIRGPGISDILKAFNSFEDKKTWCIDQGDSDAGFGIQLVIVWDGELGTPLEQIKPPKTPVKTMVEQGKTKKGVRVLQEQSEAQEEGMSPAEEMAMDQEEGKRVEAGKLV